jgi:hypothetical protein
VIIALRLAPKGQHVIRDTELPGFFLLIGKRRKTFMAPKLANSGGPTLRAAWGRYRDSHLQRKGRSNGTIENYRDDVERLMVDWLDQPLSVLGNDPSLVASRHKKITAENGPYIANGCMRSLRAIYNHARKTARSLPAENPAIAVDWNGEPRPPLRHP